MLVSHPQMVGREDLTWDKAGGFWSLGDSCPVPKSASQTLCGEGPVIRLVFKF